MTGRESLIEALDLPSELRAVQNAYWRARRDWNAREAAYLLVIREALKYLEARELPPDDEEPPV